MLKYTNTYIIFGAWFFGVIFCVCAAVAFAAADLCFFFLVLSFVLNRVDAPERESELQRLTLLPWLLRVPCAPFPTFLYTETKLDQYRENFARVVCGKHIHIPFFGILYMINVEPNKREKKDEEDV